jgi:hypothetical protein
MMVFTVHIISDGGAAVCRVIAKYGLAYTAATELLQLQSSAEPMWLTLTTLRTAVMK